MSTRSIKKDEITNDWLLVDVAGVRLGQAASKIAQLLIGKNKINSVDYLESGDNVIVINADKVDVFTKKLDSKKYYTHSGYLGGLKTKSLRELMVSDSTEVIKKAVWGMLPKTKMGRKYYANLRVYKDANFLESAQQPKEIKFN